MSALWTSLSGNIVSYPVTFSAIRWGGGADHGKTHVFKEGGHQSMSAGHKDGVRMSLQCVTDDFGNLVPVGSRQ